MSDDTKKAAEEKLAMIRNKIGYPEKWRDYSSVKVNRDRLRRQHAPRRPSTSATTTSHKLGKPVDEKEWGMTPPTVNAYYSPAFNDINFPAGILQPPFFDPNIDPAVNFGGIGVVIGHEMTHGFDDQGSQVRRQGQSARVADACGPQGLHTSAPNAWPTSTAALRRRPAKATLPP